MAQKINVVCKYFQIREVIRGEMTENIYDIRNWMLDMQNCEFYDKYKDTNGIKGRLEEQINISDNIYALNFMRMEEVSNAYILRRDVSATHVDINVEDEEYIARNTVCIYDAENGIIMIQSNRGSYSEKSIESYINSFFDEPVCSIVPIVENLNLLGENAEYMKVDIRFANLREFRATPDTCFEKIIQGMNETEGINAHLEISLGQYRNERLNSGVVRTLLRDLCNNRGCVSSAKIKLTGEQIEGVYDLFHNLGKDTINCRVNENGEITFDVLSNRMSYKYIMEHSRERVCRALRI